MATITSIHAWEILDSRGNPTVRCAVTLDDGSCGVAAVPSGASTGAHEALELRDGGKRYGGSGVRSAVKHVNGPIARAVLGMDAHNQQAMDRTLIALDGTPNKSKLGANAILAVSLACAVAAARSHGVPLYEYLRSAYDLPLRGWRMPTPMMNVVNGGRHAASGLSVQEFMIVPQHKRFSEQLRIGAEVFHALHDILAKRKLATTVGDEGGFAPVFPEPKPELVLRLILRAVKRAGYAPGKDIALALDVAASEFYDAAHRTYSFTGRFGEEGIPWTSAQMIARMEQWVKKFPLISIEDPLDEDDWEGWTALMERIGKRVHVVGDDLFVTNPARLRQGIACNAANAILIKVNQIGTLTETMEAIALAREAKYGVIISHRSGETADTFIADLAVAVNAEYIKTGSLSRSERVEKYNRLLEIEEEVA
ncbi:MAG: phosphopyruvate hydratase [bacterium]|nr:phosphopyruvate hydratase [bacterium]